MKRLLHAIFSVGILLGLLAAGAHAQYTPPVGLAPGTQYQLIFVTSDTIAATSSDINTYNSFVQSEAALDPSLPAGVTWSAVVSTSAVNAASNAPAYQLPLYWTDGYQVSNNGFAPTQSLFFAAPQLYNNPSLIGDGGLTFYMDRYDQFGNFMGRPVGETTQEATDRSPTNPPNSALDFGTPDPGSFIFTGSTAAGVASSFPAGAGSNVTDLTYGDPGDQSWNTNANTSLAPATEQLHILALSSIIIATPEPATISLAAIGLLVLVGQRLFRGPRAG